MKSAFPLILTVTLLGAAACGTKGVSIESQDPEATAVRRRPNRITAVELAELRHLNVRDAIRQLRPRWLRSRSKEDNLGGPEDPISVFVNTFFRGGEEELRRLNVSDVERIDFLSEIQTFQRFGSQHRNYGILITLRGGN